MQLDKNNSDLQNVLINLSVDEQVEKEQKKKSMKFFNKKKEKEFQLGKKKLKIMSKLEDKILDKIWHEKH